MGPVLKSPWPAFECIIFKLVKRSESYVVYVFICAGNFACHTIESTIKIDKRTNEIPVTDNRSNTNKY